jgi:mannan endo-1,4-beta-mannosidase
MAQAEIWKIHEITGKLPALCGFELLAYSPNINTDDYDDEHCVTEINENRGTLEKAYEWAERKGLVTFTWHWYSPMYGKNKTFYQENTPWDARQAVIEGTPEHSALISDMDVMAELLKGFEAKNIPILWRPFHEADGKWFWWGHHGAETAKKLWHIMFDRYVNVHNLTNLIWVWNSAEPDFYVGDGFCDIISRDLYPKANTHTDLADEYEYLTKITETPKLAALGEIGAIPSVERLAETRVPWLWFMTWSNVFVMSEKFTSYDELKRAYGNDYGVTLDKLPPLY